MSKVSLSITMSLDGFIRRADGNEDVYEGSYDASELLEELIRDTGSVLMGRNAFNMSESPDWYADNYEYQVPIFVITHDAPSLQPKENDRLNFTFVTDGLKSGVEQAKIAAGDRQVAVIGGAAIAQQLLAGDLLDEIQVAIMPALLGSGLRLFEHLGDQIRLEKVRTKESGPRTGIWFRVASPEF
jgi:dihydrofolate reductase